MCHFFAFHASKVKRDAGVECKTPSHVARVMRSTPTSWLPSLAWKTRENDACSKCYKTFPAP